MYWKEGSTRVMEDETLIGTGIEVPRELASMLYTAAKAAEVLGLASNGSTALYWHFVSCLKTDEDLGKLVISGEA